MIDTLQERRRAFGVRAPKSHKPTYWLLAADSPNLDRRPIETDWDMVDRPPGIMLAGLDGFVVRINGNQYRYSEKWTRETQDRGLCVQVKRIHPDFRDGDLVLFIHNRGLMPWMTGKGLKPHPGIVASCPCRVEIVIGPDWPVPDTDHRVVIVEEVSWKQQTLLASAGSSPRRSH